MNVEINFTCLNMGLSLCLVCNLGAIRGRFRWVFGSVLFALLFLQLKRRKAGDCRRPCPTNHSRITTQCRESPWNTVFINPHNFYIPFSLHGDRTAILVWKKLAAVPGCLLAHDQWFELTNESAECNGRIHAKSPGHGKITDSWTFFEFSQTRIAVRPPRRLSGMQKLCGFMNMVFLWLFSALRCDTRATCWTRSSAVTRLPLF